VDQNDIAALRELNQSVREAYEDRDLFKEATLGLFHNLCVHDEYGNGVYNRGEEEEQKSNDKKLSRYDVARYHLAANVDMIYDYAESPIEKLFLCNFLFISLRFSPFILAITAPIVADVFPAKMSALHQRDLDIKRDARKHKHPELSHVADMFQLFEELEPAAYSILPKHLDAMGRGLTNNIDYLINGLGQSFHVSLQPTFEKLRVEGKSIRPDMMIWVPTHPDFKLIVECDGYQYHSDKEMFSKDRIRDRVLQQQGYQVFRFSGHEIVQNATLKANEFIEYLSDLADKFDLDMEQAKQEMNTFGTNSDAKEQEDGSPKQPRRKKKKKPSLQQKRQLRQTRRRRR